MPTQADEIIWTSDVWKDLQEKGSNGGNTGKTGTGHLGGRAGVGGDGLGSSWLGGGSASGDSGIDLGVDVSEWT